MLTLRSIERLVTLASLVVGIGVTVSAQIQLKLPNGGENWEAGSWQYVHYIADYLSNLKIELSTDNGATWSVLTENASSWLGYCGFEVPYVSSSDCRIRITRLKDPQHQDMSDSTFSIHTLGGRTTWVQRSSGTMADLLSVVFVDSLRGWSCGTGGTLLATTDGGTTWQSITSGTTKTLWSIDFSPVGVGLAVGDSGTILRSADRGGTWHSLASGKTASLRDVAFASSTTAVIVGEIVLRSVDEGSTWEETILGAWNSIAFHDSLNGALSGGGDPYCSSCREGVVLTRDGGQSWTGPVDLDGIVYFWWEGIAFPSASNIVGAVYQSYQGERSWLVASTDSGNTWQVRLGEFGNNQGYSIIFLYTSLMFRDSIHGYVVGSGDGNAMVFPTTTGGASWDLKDIYYIRDFIPRDVHFSNENYGVIVGREGKIYQTTSGGLVAVGRERTDPPPKSFQLFQGHPNPFNSSTRIRFHVATTSPVRVSVFDLLGKEVVILADDVMNPGVYERTFDARLLATGIYLCRMQTPDYQQSAKLLFLK